MYQGHLSLEYEMPGCINKIACEGGRKYVEEKGRSIVARIKENMQALILPSLKPYVGISLAKRRVDAHHERAAQITIKVWTFACTRYSV